MTSSFIRPDLAAGGGAGAGAGVGAGAGGGTGSSANAGAAAAAATAAPRNVASAARRISGESTRPTGQRYAGEQHARRGGSRHGPAAVLVATERDHVVERVQTDAGQDRARRLVGEAERDAEDDQRGHGLHPGRRVDGAEDQPVEQRGAEEREARAQGAVHEPPEEKLLNCRGNAHHEEPDDDRDQPALVGSEVLKRRLFLV